MGNAYILKLRLKALEHFNSILGIRLDSISVNRIGILCESGMG